MKSQREVQVIKPARYAALLGLLLLVLTPMTARAEDKKTDQAAKLMRKGEYEQAEKIYRELLVKDTRNLRARLGLGAALLKQRKVQDAFDQAARATTIDPTSARAHALLGQTLLAGGNFRLSVEEFRTALIFDDSESMAVAGLAMINFYENRNNAALSGLRRAVFLDPSEADYVFNLAQAAARSERYKEAADAYERFLLISPTTDADRRARIRGLIDFLRYLGNQRSLYQASSPSLVTLPFESTGGRPIVKVRLNNSKETFRFVIDTGSGMSVISDRTAQALGVHPAARGGMARAVGGGGRFEIVYGFLSSIELGEASVANVPVYIRRFYNDQESIDGYIGLSLLSKFVTAIDYGSRLLMLAHSSADLPALPIPAGGAGVAGFVEPLEIPVRITSSGFFEQRSAARRHQLAAEFYSRYGGEHLRRVRSARHARRNGALPANHTDEGLRGGGSDGECFGRNSAARRARVAHSFESARRDPRP